MLNNKLILCIGNNTRQTDQLASEVAAKYQTVNLGLLTSTTAELQEQGVYHTSLGDLGSVTPLVNLAAEFDHVLFFNQSADSYSDERTYDLTKFAIELIENRLEIPVEIINA
jgi:hypothetical protein